MATTNRTASYKGRTYKLLFLGDTKVGRRAHLSFLDGTKDFWVAADLVTEGDAIMTADTGRAKCADCDKPGVLVRDMEDGLMKHLRCCDMPPE